MISESEFYKNDITKQRWLGRVVDREDPESEGRIKIKVFGLYDKLETEDIPWAYPDTTTTAGSDSGGSFYSIPKLDSVVEVKFISNDPYNPVYTRNIHLSEEVKNEIDGDENAHVIWYDSEEQLKVFYTQSKGLIINLNKTVFNITNDNEIVIKNNNNVNVLKFNKEGNVTLKTDVLDIVANDNSDITTPTLNLRGTETNLGAAPEFSDTLAEPLWAFLKVLATATDSKWPATPGVLSSAAEAAEQASTSQTVKTSI